MPKISINLDNLNFTFEVVRCTGDPWSLASTINEYTPFPSASIGSPVASRSKSIRVVMTPCSWNIYEKRRYHILTLFVKYLDAFNLAEALIQADTLLLLLL